MDTTFMNSTNSKTCNPNNINLDKMNLSMSLSEMLTFENQMQVKRKLSEPANQLL